MKIKKSQKFFVILFWVLSCFLYQLDESNAMQNVVHGSINRKPGCIEFLREARRSTSASMEIYRPTFASAPNFSPLSSSGSVDAATLPRRSLSRLAAERRQSAIRVLPPAATYGENPEDDEARPPRSGSFYSDQSSYQPEHVDVFDENTGRWIAVPQRQLKNIPENQENSERRNAGKTAEFTSSNSSRVDFRESDSPKNESSSFQTPFVVTKNRFNFLLPDEQRVFLESTDPKPSSSKYYASDIVRDLRNRKEVAVAQSTLETFLNDEVFRYYHTRANSHKRQGERGDSWKIEWKNVFSVWENDLKNKNIQSLSNLDYFETTLMKFAAFRDGGPLYATWTRELGFPQSEFIYNHFKYALASRDDGVKSLDLGMLFTKSSTGEGVPTPKISTYVTTLTTFRDDAQKEFIEKRQAFSNINKIIDHSRPWFWSFRKIEKTEENLIEQYSALVRTYSEMKNSALSPYRLNIEKRSNFDLVNDRFLRDQLKLCIDSDLANLRNQVGNLNELLQTVRMYQRHSEQISLHGQQVLENLKMSTIELDKLKEDVELETNVLTLAPIFHMYSPGKVGLPGLYQVLNEVQLDIELDALAPSELLSLLKNEDFQAGYKKYCLTPE